MIFFFTLSNRTFYQFIMIIACSFLSRVNHRHGGKLWLYPPPIFKYGRELFFFGGGEIINILNKIMRKSYKISFGFLTLPPLTNLKGAYLFTLHYRQKKMIGHKISILISSRVECPKFGDPVQIPDIYMSS